MEWERQIRLIGLWLKIFRLIHLKEENGILVTLGSWEEDGVTGFHLLGQLGGLKWRMGKLDGLIGRMKWGDKAWEFNLPGIKLFHYLIAKGKSRGGI